jgi:hypothetical protein
MDSNYFILPFRIILLVTLVLIGSITSLTISSKITNYIFSEKINIKYPLFPAVTFLSILVLLIYLIHTVILRKIFIDSLLVQASFIIIGPIISVYSVMMKDSHITFLLKKIFHFLHERTKKIRV